MAESGIFLQLYVLYFSTSPISFINELDEVNRKRIFLLTDYELLGQRMNGLDVINKTKITRAILVTSHANDKLIRSTAQLATTKVLPKKLAPEVKITLM